jgi:SNF2 family DNA or RNA helicase
MNTYTPKGAQAEALRRSAGRTGFAFFLEQGLGKTSTTCADFLHHVDSHDIQRAVVFCPNSFKGGWVEEIQKWGFDIDPYIYTPDNESYIRSAMKRGFDKPPMLIVNFEAARTPKAQQLIADWCAGRRVFGVVDESIAIAKHDSQQTRAVLNMGKELFTMTRILSGKPITQGPHDLWSQMRFIKQLDGFNYFAFRNAFCKMGGFKAKQVVGAINEDILAERIDPHIFRATKAEWTDLPPKVYTVREYKMTLEMKSMYKSMEDEFTLWLNDEESVSVDAAITKYIKLAQIQAGFILDEQGKTRWLVEPKNNPRLNVVEEILNDEIVGKATVVYRHRAALEMLMERFTALNPTYIKGGMSSEDIEEQKRIFNNDKTSRVMFLQTDAAKYGHTLLGLQNREDHCSSQIFFETSYSLDARSQIEDRSHRYGQLGECMSYYDLYGTPLDRDVVKALQRKESVFQAVFNLIGKKGPAAS